VKLRPTQGISLTSIASEGSATHVQLLEDNQAQFALLSGLIAYYAWSGEGPFAANGPHSELRSVAALWQEAEHFIVRRGYADTGTITDMRALLGKPVSMGLAGSGTIASNRLLMSRFGVNIERDMNLVYLGYDESAEALQRGDIEAMSTAAGVPVGAVTRAFSALGRELVILQFSEQQWQTADGGLGLWSPYVIAAGTYPTVNHDVDTIAAANVLAVRADVNEESVYWITRTMYENLPFLQAIHKALLGARLDSALAGLPMPLHPGALRYYREVGLDVPARLIA
jgi:TRAP transporter TAXI family solute receptor